MSKSISKIRSSVRIATLSACTLWHPSLSLAQEVDLTSDTLVGISLADGKEQGTCTLTVSKDGAGNIVSMSISGTAKRKTAGLPNQPELASTTIAITKEANTDEWWSFSSFTPLPSIAHLGYMRVALQMRLSTFENPWPGIQEVKYIVQKGNYKKIIARSDIHLVPNPIAMGYDHMECLMSLMGSGT
ncbi:MAG: hypothetical protein NTY08_06125 [Proteobacteria bacterium]|nr:hypothetical protein [Pseudomonadota bacterium]